MLAVEKWAQGKNPGIAFIAINLAVVARMQCEALRHIKERRVYGYQFPLPDLLHWIEMAAGGDSGKFCKLLVIGDICRDRRDWMPQLVPRHGLCNLQTRPFGLIGNDYDRSRGHRGRKLPGASRVHRNLNIHGARH